MERLLNRYRCLLGEERYRVRAADGTSVAEALFAVKNALLLLAPTLELSSIKPIPFRPPEPLPALQLTRAVLAELRPAEGGLVTEALVTRLMFQHNIVLGTNTELVKFTRRVHLCAEKLTSKGVLRKQCLAWHIQA